MTEQKVCNNISQGDFYYGVKILWVKYIILHQYPKIREQVKFYLYTGELPSKHVLTNTTYLSASDYKYLT